MTEPLHRQDFRVHSYEVDTEGLLAPRALCAYLQEAAGGDAARGGYTMERLAEEGLVWVIQWMRVEVERYPVRGETLTVTTWARPFGRALAFREFDVVDGPAPAWRWAPAAGRWWTSRPAGSCACPSSSAAHPYPSAPPPSTARPRTSSPRDPPRRSGGSRSGGGTSIWCAT